MQMQGGDHYKCVVGRSRPKLSLEGGGFDWIFEDGIFFFYSFTKSLLGKNKMKNAEGQYNAVQQCT